MSTATPDLSSFTVEQLQEALQKRGTIISNEAEVKRCVFKPTRAGQSACSDDSSVFYGSNGYCKKHCRTVQALNARKEWEEASKNVEVSKNNPEPEVEKKDEEPPKPEVKEKVSEEPESLAVVEEVKKVEPKEEQVSPPPTNIPPKSAVSETPKESLVSRTVVKKKISRNKWGRFEEPDTGIVFDPNTKAAFGVQDHKTGKLLALSKKHIELCEKYHWQ